VDYRNIFLPRYNLFVNNVIGNEQVRVAEEGRSVTEDGGLMTLGLGANLAGPFINYRGHS
jgi:hypothetical protein